jgi:hypothetical protein
MDLIAWNSRSPIVLAPDFPPDNFPGVTNVEISLQAKPHIIRMLTSFIMRIYICARKCLGLHVVRTSRPIFSCSTVTPPAKKRNGSCAVCGSVFRAFLHLSPSLRCDPELCFAAIERGHVPNSGAELARCQEGTPTGQSRILDRIAIRLTSVHDDCHRSFGDKGGI